MNKENLREFVYKPVEFGFHCSIFELIEVNNGPMPTSPKLGDRQTLNTLLNLVYNGNVLTIVPSEKTT